MPKPSHSRGFSLILSLTIMAGIVMLVITLSSFITIESRAAMNQQLAARARLNGILAMRPGAPAARGGAGPAGHRPGGDHPADDVDRRPA